jgi:HSP20 family protein
MLPIRKKENWLPSIFNDVFDNDWMFKSRVSSPAVNVIDSEKEYTVEIASPGMSKDDFSIRVDDDNDCLVISMEKKNAQEDKKEGRYLRREFSYAQSQHILTLPDNVDKDKIEAQIKDGILRIELPKKSEKEIQKKQRLIEIKE